MCQLNNVAMCQYANVPIAMRHVVVLRLIGILAHY